jgi:hypothetical protein
MKNSGTQLIVLVMVILLVWAFSLWVVTLALSTPVQKLDLANVFTVLFGASSIALFILSLLVALVAIIGWQSLKDHIKQGVSEEVAGVKEEMKKTTESLENEVRGRVWTVLAYDMAQASLDPETLEPSNRQKLEDAVRMFETASQYLQHLSESTRIMGLNNILYYSCALGLRGQEHRFLKQARTLRDLGQEHKSINLQLTACRVFLQYSTDSRERKEAVRLLEAILSQENISSADKKEAQAYLKKNWPLSSELAITTAIVPS